VQLPGYKEESGSKKIRVPLVMDQRSPDCNLHCFFHFILPEFPGEYDMQSDWDIRFVKGELTPISKEICEEEEQNNTVQECEAFLLYKYYNANEVLDKHFLWTQESVNRNSVNLLINYIIVIASISGTLFSLVEILSWSMFKKPA
jgi:hypothetical protein